MKKNDAEKLWGSIISYSYWVGELMGEGNSGEFSNVKESNRIVKAFTTAEEKLINDFSETTGWFPKEVLFELWKLDINEYSDDNYLVDNEGYKLIKDFDFKCHGRAWKLIKHEKEKKI